MEKGLRHLQERTAQGDERAFEQLFRLFKDRVYDLAFMYTESRVLSEEILQDIFIQVWTKRTELTSVSDFNAWLYILTRNRSFNVLRAMVRAENREREMIDYLPQFADDADHRLLHADIQNLLAEGMKRLTPAQQQAFELFKLKGLSREQTAAAMRISPNTVKVHLLQASRIMRAFLLAHTGPQKKYMPVVMLLALLAADCGDFLH